MVKKLAVLVAAGALALAGCGDKKATTSAASSPATTSKSTSTPDCTKLVTEDEATKLFGKQSNPPSGGLNTTGDAESFCDWDLADKSDTSVLLQIQAFNDIKFVPKDAYDASKVADVSVPGTSEAFSVNERATETTVNIAAKNKRVVITYTPADKNGSAHVAEVTALAAIVSSRVS